MSWYKKKSVWKVVKFQSDICLINQLRMQKEQNSKDVQQYVGPYKLDKTLGKGQTGNVFHFNGR